MPRIYLAFVVALAISCTGDKTRKVPPAVAVTPTSLDFHVVAVGQTAHATVKVDSQTTSPVILSAVTLEGADASAFAVAGNPGRVEGGSSAELTLSFTPTEQRAYHGQLTISSDDPDHPKVSVALTGNGALEQVEVHLEAPTGCTAQLNEDGGLSIDFGLVPEDTTQVVWPNLLLENLGGAPAQLTGYAFDTDAGLFYFPQPPTVPQTLARLQTRSVPIAFRRPGDARTDFTGAVTLAFDDPATPSVSVTLAAHVSLDQPPVACAGIVSVEELDGTTQRPASFGAPVQVEPGARVHLTAFSDDVADAGPGACSSDPEDGRALTFRWSVAEAPAGSRAALAQTALPHTDFIPDVPGHYRLALGVTDSHNHTASAGLAFDAAPLADLTVRLAWPSDPGVDFDLHFVRPGGQPFAPADDLYSFSADAGHDWGATGDPTDDPHFSGDDQGNGALTELARLNRPWDGCLGDGGCLYGVWVHYYQDRRSLTGAATCGQGGGCVEGQACGCSASQSCEPDPTQGGLCAPWPAPEVEVYFKGQVAPALKVPLAGLGSPLTPSPCFTWHALDVAFPGPDAGLALAVADGGAPVVEYWGDHTDPTRQCTPGAAGWGPTNPPLKQ